MLYYYNRDGRFQKESSKEYKTEKGAVDKLEKEGVGAVFDETGKLVTELKKEPEGTDNGQEPEGADNGQEPEGADNGQEPEGADNGQEPEGTDNGQEPEGADNGQEPEGADNGQEPEGADNGQEPEGTDNGQEPEGADDEQEFDVYTTCDSLKIRSGAGQHYKKVGAIIENAADKKPHTIVEVKNGWGKLKSGAGWISLAFTKKVGQ